MARLYFRLGQMEGFTSKTNAGNSEGFGIPIRELMQNSLDATDTDESDRCDVEILIDKINRDDIPMIDDYECALEQGVVAHKNMKSFGDLQKQLVDNLRFHLKEKHVDILMFVDNGRGMDRDDLNALIEQRSRDKASGIGSYGVGHLSAYDLSSLRYVLYATRKNGETLFTGVPILAGFRDGSAERGNIGRILKKFPPDEKNPDFEYLDTAPAFMEKALGERTHGTVVCVVSLSDKWENDCESVVAGNFFSAILHERLSVRVQDCRPGGSEVRLDEARIKKVLERNRDGQRANANFGEILSGRDTWNSFQAVQAGKIALIELGNGDRVNVHVRCEDVAASSVVLVRSDMLIARHDKMIVPDFDNLRKSSDFAPFAMVIDVDKGRAPELFGLVRSAEGPYHSELTRKEISKERLARLRKLLRELAGKVREHLPEVHREGFDLPLFETQTATERPVKASTALVRPPPPPPTPPPPPRPPGPERTPLTFTRVAPAKMVMEANRTAGGGWQVRMLVEPTADTKAADRAWLSFGLDEDSDGRAVHARLQPTAATVNGIPVEPADMAELMIPLGRLRQSSSISVDATLEQVENGGGYGKGMTVAVGAFLSLRSEKGRKLKSSGNDSEETS